MNHIAQTTRKAAGGAAKLALVLGMLLIPMMTVQTVNAGSEYTIGQTQTMSNGAGLVLLMSLQRG